MAAHTPPQTSITDYEAVHAWWWAVYADVLGELKEQEPEMWAEVDRWVAH